jgi:hypothetical protein
MGICIWISLCHGIDSLALGPTARKIKRGSSRNTALSCASSWATGVSKVSPPRRPSRCKRLLQAESLPEAARAKLRETASALDPLAQFRASV